MTRDARRLRAALLALPLVLLTVLGLSAGPAAAHAVLDSSDPAAGSRLPAAPTTVTLVFSEDVGLNARSVQVLDGRGRRLDRADPAHVNGDPRTVRVGLPAGLEEGSYTVTWRVASADGHPASGTFAFGVGVPAGSAPPPVAVDPVVAAVRALAQLATYAGAALLIGGSCFLFGLWPGGVADAGLRRLLVIGVSTAGVGALATLLVQGPYVAGLGLSRVVDPALLTETVSSGYGRPLLLRVLAVALAVPVLGIWPRLSEGDEGGPGGVSAIATMVLLAASFALTGHAAEASPRLLAEAADGVHLAAAGVWLGGLVVLLAAFLPAADQTQRAAVLPRWSRVAMACVAVIAATGAYQAWREVRAVAALPGTAYGRLLLGKLALVAVLLVTALAARRRLQAVLSSSAAAAPSGVSRLRGWVTVEAVLGLAVLGVTSFLVATPPARQTFGPPYATSLTAQGVEGRAIRVAVAVTPTRVGPQTVRVEAFGADGEALAFASATAQLRAEVGEGTIGVLLTSVAPGEATGRVVVPAAGRWTLTVHVLTDATTDYAAATTYRVR